MGKLYFFTGTEEFSVKERAGDFIRELFGDMPEEDDSLEIIQGDNADEKYSAVLDKFITSIETPPFLTPSKTVWLKHFNKFDDALDEPSNKKKKSRIDTISDFLKDGFYDDMTIIIDGVGLDRRKAFFKLCEKVCASSGGKMEWFDKIDAKDKSAAMLLYKKIKEMADSFGKRIDEGAVSFLTETVGSDIPRLKNEIGKLASYAGENNSVITLADCREICSRSQETLSWEFSSALAERNAAEAISLIPGIIETLEQEKSSSSSSAEIAILYAANSEFQRLLAAKCESIRFSIPSHANYNYFKDLCETQKRNDPGNPLFSMHPFRAFKVWENSRRFTDVEMADAFNAILHASKQMVTGGDPRLALERLVTKIAGKPKKT
ncbi:MAG: hypothetical protein IKC08_09395 [Lentisphaeria bacterium]|nr:hypothetical protein [Lentisphaeria bacterium]